MSSKYRFGEPHLPHFVSFAVVDWVDVFTRNEYRNIFVESLKYCIGNKGLILNAWILMTNHVHLVMKANINCEPGQILRDLKKFTSTRLIAAIQNNPKEIRKDWMLYRFARTGEYNSNNKEFQFWQQDNHPIELSTPAMLKQRMDYMHENPVRAGYVHSPEEYVFGSGVDYYTNRKGLIEIERLYS